MLITVFSTSAPATSFIDSEKKSEYGTEGIVCMKENDRFGDPIGVWRSVDPGGNGWAIFSGIHPGNGHLYVSSDMSYSLFRSRARGQIVRIEFDLRVLQRERQDWWLRWAEGCEVERFPPQLCLYEVRERNLNRIVAETYIERYNATPENYIGQWIHLVSEGRVSEHALGLNLVLTGTGMHSGILEAKASNLSLRIVEDSGTPTCRV
jgi:hypothetical protein